MTRTRRRSCCCSGSSRAGCGPRRCSWTSPAGGDPCPHSCAFLLPCSPEDAEQRGPGDEPGQGSDAPACGPPGAEPAAQRQPRRDPGVRNVRAQPGLPGSGPRLGRSRELTGVLEAAHTSHPHFVGGTPAASLGARPRGDPRVRAQALLPSVPCSSPRVYSPGSSPDHSPVYKSHQPQPHAAKVAGCQAPRPASCSPSLLTRSGLGGFLSILLSILLSVTVPRLSRAGRLGTLPPSPG
nr:uncharacterized protein LOC101434979 [Dasypus novemcinctus]